MKIRAVILAGGEGSRLGVLTHKRTKPAVPFAGKYRIIDFALSNCVNSEIYDVMLIAQYRPHSLIEHIGAGGPWDLNRDFTGGIRIYTPFKARRPSDWFTGTADAVQQNFSFIKRGDPDFILLLSGDHIYTMNYDAMVTYHLTHQAELTMATYRVPLAEAHRFGVVGVSEEGRVTSFVEKPKNPSSDLINMGVYLFSRELLDRALWEDHIQEESSHDFGKDIIPRLIKTGEKVYAFPYEGYWVDVGTSASYWQAHMDLLNDPPALNLNDRRWIIHTRTEERPPVRLARGSEVIDSMLSDGCMVESGARVIRSVLSPGVVVESGAVVEESILLTDSIIEHNASLYRAVLDKRVRVGANASLGRKLDQVELRLVMIGKSSVLPPGIVIHPGATVGVDVVPEDFSSSVLEPGEIIQTRRLANEI